MTCEAYTWSDRPCANVSCLRDSAIWLKARQTLSLLKMLLTTLAFVGAIPLISAAESEPLSNARHVFNAIESSMRQWGSSLNHNGMSFFLATLPAGTQLHHGTGSDVPVTGMEWLAFEPEHALRFAWNVHLCDDPDKQHIDELSLKWSWPHNLAHPSEFPSTQHDPRHQEALGHRPPRPPLCLTPGYIHTYSPTHPLRLLYIDGQSAAKSLNGTLDSQDYILLHSFSRPDPVLNDGARAEESMYPRAHDFPGTDRRIPTHGTRLRNHPL